MFLLSNSTCWCPPVAVARLFSSLDAPRTHHDPANVATGLGSQIHPFDSMSFLRSPRHHMAKVFVGAPARWYCRELLLKVQMFPATKRVETEAVSILALLNLATRRRWQLDKLGHLVMFSSQLSKRKEPAFRGLLSKRQQTAPSHQRCSKGQRIWGGLRTFSHVKNGFLFQILLQSLLRNTN